MSRILSVIYEGSRRPHLVVYARVYLLVKVKVKAKVKATSPPRTMSLTQPMRSIEITTTGYMKHPCIFFPMNTNGVSSEIWSLRTAFTPPSPSFYRCTVVLTRTYVTQIHVQISRFRSLTSKQVIAMPTVAVLDKTISV
jgi:hypothetical protein